MNPELETISGMLYVLRKKMEAGRDDEKLYEMILYWSGRRELIRQLRSWGQEGTRLEEIEKLTEDLYRRPSPLAAEKGCKKCERCEKLLAREKNLRAGRPRAAKPPREPPAPRPPATEESPKGWMPPALSWE